MQYTLEFAGRSYDLPKFTKSVKDEISKIDARNADTRVNDTDKYKGMYNFIRKMIGADAALEIFETENLDEMDLNDITICFLGIGTGYDKPVNEYARGGNKISEEDKKLVLEVLKNSGNIQNLEKIMSQQQNQGVRPPFRAL